MRRKRGCRHDPRCSDGPCEVTDSAGASPHLPLPLHFRPPSWAGTGEAREGFSGVASGQIVALRAPQAALRRGPTTASDTAEAAGLISGESSGMSPSPPCGLTVPCDALHCNAMHSSSWSAG